MTDVDPESLLQTLFAADHHAVCPTQATVYGVISLVICTITIIVSVKYVEGALRAFIDEIREMFGLPDNQTVVLGAHIGL